MGSVGFSGKFPGDADTAGWGDHQEGGSSHLGPAAVQELSRPQTLRDEPWERGLSLGRGLRLTPRKGGRTHCNLPPTSSLFLDAPTQRS